MKKHGVVEVVDENKSCDSGMKTLTLKWVDNMNGNGRRSQLVSGAIKKFEKRDDQRGPEGTMSEELKMLMMTRQDDLNRKDNERAPSHLYGDVRRRIHPRRGVSIIIEKLNSTVFVRVCRRHENGWTKREREFRSNVKT